MSDSCLRGWMALADIDDGRRPRLTSGERAEHVTLRRERRVLELENEILRSAAACFARENVLQNDVRLHRSALCRHASQPGVSSDEDRSRRTTPRATLRPTRHRGCSPTDT